VYPVAESLQNIAVIGAAINGLVAANYVQRAGDQVTLLERSERQVTAAVIRSVTSPASRPVHLLHKLSSKEAGSIRTGLFVCGSGGVICTVPTLPIRIRLR